jgi:Acyl-CoA carboxylase epsilon subunit
MNQENGTDGAPETNGAAHEHVDIHIERGKPTDEEIAALVAVLCATGGTPGPATQEHNMWGHPVANLRFAIFSWERVTLLQRTYMRR